MWRVAFFLGLALSAILPLAHMAALYGLVNTLSFFRMSSLSLLSFLLNFSDSVSVPTQSLPSPRYFFISQGYHSTPTNVSFPAFLGCSINWS